MNDTGTLEITSKPTENDKREIANMDEFDYLTLLLESRIIQAS